MKIYAPNQQYTGISASVGFVNGVGETTDPHLIEWFLERGYKVEIDQTPQNDGDKAPEGAADTNQTPEGDGKQDKPVDLEEMSVAELMKYAAEKNIDIGKSTSYEGVLKKIKDAEAEK